MPQIEIYTSPTCGYCHAAKRRVAFFLPSAYRFEASAVSASPVTRQMRQSGSTSAPIFS